MSAMPNSHQALLRVNQVLAGRIALLGVSAPELLAQLPQGGLAMSDHVGQAGLLAGQPGWQVAFGYDHLALRAAAFDTVVVFLPKARTELDFRLALARKLIATGGRLLVVGEKKEGIAGAVKQLKTVAPGATKLDSARHCQIWSAEGVEPLDTFDVTRWMQWHTVSRAGVTVDVCGLPGIFSHGELDDGTGLLLDTLAETPITADRILDFACGAGVIGTWLQSWQRQNGRACSEVDGLDVQSQAVICAQATYERGNAKGNILASDGLDGVEGTWSAMVTNPPFHSGVKTDTSMTERFLQSVSRHLRPGGELRLVANTFLPYSGLIQRCIGPVERLHEDRRFTVYRAFRR
ncbi:class I SAM-dependent methyltransferase [Marinobacter salinisoli]|uniref:Ribosomal RNA small subunit methyltransferase C n=1 Tax=Marinobacter salinisoli TaxID=2769486 RepID=A0ABX7MQ75_9GAMM|nr:class I SAM-dependent methyltransferase [Marinobacter salinisoli]QSP94358.1 class I SAM-dependent methyltransferase [Marinobacter salinisoli]